MPSAARGLLGQRACCSGGVVRAAWMGAGAPVLLVGGGVLVLAEVVEVGTGVIVVVGGRLEVVVGAAHAGSTRPTAVKATPDYSKPGQSMSMEGSPSSVKQQPRSTRRHLARESIFSKLRLLAPVFLERRRVRDVNLQGKGTPPQVPPGVDGSAQLSKGSRCK
jgi:hypothetical protein